MPSCELEVTVTPALRPEGEAAEWELREGPGAEAWERIDRLPPEMRQYFRQFGVAPGRPGRGAPGLWFRQFRPGIVFDEESGEKNEVERRLDELTSRLDQTDEVERRLDELTERLDLLQKAIDSLTAERDNEGQN